jgi:hypothetical protein
MSNRMYLMAQEAQARKNYLSANGRNAWTEASGGFSGDGWDNANAWTEADASSAPPVMVAPAPAAPKEMIDRSEPIIIQVVNSATSAVANVELFSANKSYILAAPNFQNGASISITSNIQGITYTEMLANSQQKPFKVGETLIISSSAGQTEQTVAVQHKTDTGKLIKYTITPVQDPYQQLSDRVISNYEYIMDGFTSLTINQLNASATVTIYLYLKKRFSPTSVVAAGAGAQTQNYGNPQIMRFSRPFYQVGQ